MLDYYKKGSKQHRSMFKKVMDLQEKVFFEGKESLKLVERISKTPLVFFPNYVFDNQIPTKMPTKPKDNIGLLYFGRIAPNKNIDIILDVFEILCKKHDNLSLIMIGGIGQSKAYAEKIDYRISKSPYKTKITRMGLTSFEEIKKIMQTQHFFIFPSKEKAEGHSNSLNEAMSQGLIPIVSDYHFNRSIVGDERLIVDGFDADQYAKKIERIINDGSFYSISEQMWLRVKNNYTGTIVLEKIKQELNN